MNIPELMIEIRDRPESFIRDDCIFQLRAFIRGFVFAKNASQQGRSVDHNILVEFDNQLKKLYDIDPEEIVSIEELLEEYEGSSAFSKYIEHWFEYAKG